MTTMDLALDLLAGTGPEYSGGLADRAIATDDEHAIKFTEACLREHAGHPAPVYLLAAHHAVTRLERSH